VQTVQSDGICVEVLARRRTSRRAAQQAAELALKIANELGVVGVMR